MTRALDTQLGLDLAHQYAEAAYFLEMQFSGATLFLTTAPRDVDWGGDTYQSIGGLEFDGVGEVLDDRGQGLGLTLGGVDLAIVAQILAQTYRGRVSILSYGHFAQSTNLCSNGDLETAGLGYVTLGASAARTQAYAKFGAWCLSVATTNLSGAGVRMEDNDGLNNHCPVTAGMPYIGSAWVRLAPPEPAHAMRVGIQWFNAANTSLSHDSTVITTLRGEDGFVRLETQAGIAPATAVGACLRIDTSGAQGVFTFYVDGAQFEPGEVAHGFQSTNAGAVQGGSIVGTPVEMFRGFMNSGFEVQEERDTMDGGTCRVSTRIVSRLAELSQVRGVQCNVDSHARLFPGDKFFQHVPGLVARHVWWGMNEPHAPHSPFGGPRPPAGQRSG